MMVESRFLREEGRENGNARATARKEQKKRIGGIKGPRTQNGIAVELGEEAKPFTV